MLHVPTFLARSGIHGVGLFAAEPIAKGTLVWSFDEAVDFRLSIDDVVPLPAAARERLRIYVYFEKPGVMVLCGDNARFMNHSPESNCDEDGPYRTVASKDIAAGAEITCDYRQLGVMPADAADDAGLYDRPWDDWEEVERRVREAAGAAP